MSKRSGVKPQFVMLMDFVGQELERVALGPRCESSSGKLAGQPEGRVIQRPAHFRTWGLLRTVGWEHGFLSTWAHVTFLTVSTQWP